MPPPRRHKNKEKRPLDDDDSDAQESLQTRSKASNSANRLDKQTLGEKQTVDSNENSLNTSAVGSHDDEIRNLRKNNRLLIKSYRQHSEQLEAAKQETDELRAETNELRAETNELRAEINQLNETVQQQTTELSEMRNSLREGGFRQRTGMSPLYPESSTLVNSRKLEFCNISGDWRIFSAKLVTCIFSVSDIYRRNVNGGQSKNNNNRAGHSNLPDGHADDGHGDEMAIDACKLRIDRDKLNELYQAVRLKFPDLVNENAKRDRWKSMVNSILNHKLGCLNRHFNELIKNHYSPDNRTNRYPINKEDRYEFAEYQLYLDNPAKFQELNEAINRQLEIPI